MDAMASWTCRRRWHANVPRVEQHVAAVQPFDAQRLATLRRSGYRRQRALAPFRGLPRGYGHMPSWSVFGPHRQRRQLRTGQLPLGDFRATDAQPAAEWRRAPLEREVDRP